MVEFLHKSERRKMGAQEDKTEQERPAINAAAKEKNPPLIRTSPYMKRSLLQPVTHKNPPNRASAPVPGARNAKTPSKSSSSSISGTASAPASSIRPPAGSVTALSPALKAKRGASSVSIGVTRERHSAPLLRMKYTTPYVLVPVRMKKTGLKLLDPEKVKNLTSASPLPASEVKRTLILHQTTLNKQPHWSRRQRTLPGPAAQQTESSRQRPGIASRRENMNQSGRAKILLADKAKGDHQISQKMNSLLQGDNGCDDSRTHDDQVYHGPLQSAPPGDRPHVHGDTCSMEESNIQESSHLTGSPTTSERTNDGIIIKQGSGTSVTEHEQLPEDYKEQRSQPSPYHEEENQATKQNQDPPTDPAPPRCSDIKVVDGSSREDSLYNPSTEDHCQEKCQSSHPKDTGDHNSQPGTLLGENNSWSHTGADSVGLECEKHIIILGSELNPTETRNREEPSQHVWSRTNEIIRQSQGVLVLTRSTDENAIFIPKLKFEFTPDNSIDWALLRPPLGTNKGGPAKGHDPRIMIACTSGGPSFSKSVLKKSSMLPDHGPPPGGHSESTPRSSSAGGITATSVLPLDRIVDLSISFHGKFGEQEIPTDIPKLLLTEEDIDED
ncbi:uncharacterized protein LOC142659187 isoform X2 [Rhinoderma darwinii]|uniref:uncharacterized protein LOC142659187 isoform X2 n=1 Tax=Rhinoderma darwinii TaxID=43563 RepID=UPI003F674C84